MVNACTIVARNYLPHARVLAASFRQHHPEGEFSVLIIDDEQRELDASGEPFTSLRLADIGLSIDEIGRLAGIYDVTELATAVKPRLLAWLLASGRDHIIYLDPDIKIYDTLDGIARLAAEHDIVLTPHTMVPVPRDGRRIDGLHILGAGVYNLGFVAVGAGGTSFIEWWWENTRREALMDHQRMMFTDQRWIDFVPSFFRHYILKDPGCNVAYWNLHARALRWTGDQYEVDGQPLRFFHFSGFDHRRPHLLSKHQGDKPRILLSERPDLARICGEYRQDLLAAGIGERARLDYGWRSLPNGLAPDKRIRRVYWAALVAHERDHDPEPPNPFDARTVEHFVAWLNQPDPKGPRTISRYLRALYLDRPDLQLAFPDINGEDASRFRTWVHGDGAAQEKVPAALLPPLAAAPDTHRFAAPDELRPGVNVAGYLSAELGIGEAARLMIGTLDHAGIPSSTITYTETSSRKLHAFEPRGDDRAPYDTNLICVNADRTPHFAREIGRGFFAGRRTAGYWFWELERFPDVMYPGFAYVDEVWAATKFVTATIASTNQRPVFTVPVPIPVPTVDPSVSRAQVGLPENRFLFLFIFDFFSIIERKNPLGLITAFTRAFTPDEGPMLVLKTINGHKRLNDLEQLKYAIGDRPDIRVMEEYLTAPEKNALVGLADCYVSLHRSEGLGLTMAEAMGLGKPVIATGYSGNLDFMTPENSYLVDYTMGRVGPDSDPYPEGTPWAEPSIDAAAEMMRRVVDEPAEAAARARRGREDILGRHGVSACAPILRQRVEHLRAVRRSTVAVTEHQVVPQASIAASPPPPVDSTLNAARSMLTPAIGLPGTARFRGLRLRLQAILLRALRPYWWQQRELNALLIDAVRGVNERRAADADAKHADLLHQIGALRERLAGDNRAEIEALALRLGQMEGQHRSFALRAAERLDAAEQTVDAIAGDAASARQIEHHLRSEIDEIQERLERAEATVGSGRALEASLTTLSEGVEGFQHRAADHLADLTRHLGEVAAETRTLAQRLYAAPYMADPLAFRIAGEDGREALGYEGGAEAVGIGVYLAFEDTFRGGEAFIRDRLAFYLPLLRGRGPVLDVGCGRGEMLDLLRDEGVAAQGVDLDRAMVERCRAKGLNVVESDALAYLRDLAPGTLGAMVATQFIEHLPYAVLNEFLSLARARLAQGGVLIAETVNPHALEAFKTFWTDLTHQAPIFPEVALALCRLHGFGRARVVFPGGTGDYEDDRRNIGTYAVIATA